MNERIRQLLNEATVGLEPDLSTHTTITHNELAKFAEFIVRECIKFCEHEFNDDEYDEHDTGMWIKAQSIKTSIMEEFGIKE